MVKDLKRIKNSLVVNNGIYYLSDVIPADATVTSQNSADTSAPLIEFTTPNGYTDMVYLAVVMDSTAAANFKFFLEVSSLVNISPSKYKQTLAQTFQFDDGIKIRLRPQTKVTLRAFNFTTNTTNGNYVLFWLADMLSSGV